MKTKLLRGLNSLTSDEDKKKLEEKIKKKIDFLREKYDEYDSNHPYRQSKVTQRISFLVSELKNMSGEVY